MGWKNWSYWLRGGIIVSLVTLILILFLYSKVQILFVISYFGLAVLYIPLALVLGNNFFGMGCFALGGGQCNNFLLFLSLFVSGFIFGAIIGLIVGKFKKKV